MSELRYIQEEKMEKFRILDLHVLDDDHTLSARAKYIHTYMTTRKEGWKLYLKDIIKRVTDGERAIRTALDELLDAKYVYRFSKRGEGNVIEGYLYCVYSRPIEENEALERANKANLGFKLIPLGKRNKPITKVCDLIEENPCVLNAYTEKPCVPNAGMDDANLDGTGLDDQGITDISITSSNKTVLEEEYPASQSIPSSNTKPTEQPSAESSIKTTKTFKRVNIDINQTQDNQSTPCKLNTPCKEDNTPLEGKTFRRPSKDELDFSKCDKPASKSNNGARGKRIEYNTPIKDDIDEIISFWRLKKLKFLTEEDYKFCRNIIKDIMSGIFFDHKAGLNETYKGKIYTKEQIVQSIENFHKAALDINYTPTKETTKRSMAKLKMQDFFYNSYAIEINKTLEYPIPLSNFISNLENPPKLIPQGNIRLIEDQYPALTIQIKKYYCEKVNGRLDCKFSSSDENCFRLSSKKYMEFIERNRSKILSGFFLKKEPYWAEVLIKAIIISANEDVKLISPGWLSSDRTFSARIPTFFHEEGITNKYYGEVKKDYEGE